MRVHILFRREPLAVIGVAVDLSRLHDLRKRDRMNWPDADYEISSHELWLRGEQTRRRKLGVTRHVLQVIRDRAGVRLVELRRAVYGRNEDIAESLRFLVRHGYVTRVTQGAQGRGRGYQITAEGGQYLRTIAAVPAPPKKGSLIERVREVLSGRILSAEQIAVEVFKSGERRDRNRAASLAHHLVRCGRAVVEDGKFLG